MAAIAAGALLATLGPVTTALADHGDPGKACQSRGRAAEKNPHCDYDGDGVPNGADSDPRRGSAPGGRTSRTACPYPNANPRDCDNDGVPNNRDNCPDVTNGSQDDSDGDGKGDVCDDQTDMDGDLKQDGEDNCPKTFNPDQANQDGDDQGDACDSDRDNDGLNNDADNCPDAPNPDQANQDHDDEGDACDSDADGNGTADAIEAARRQVVKQTTSLPRRATAAVGGIVP